MRRADEYYMPIKWYIVQDGSNLTRKWIDFLDLMAFDADKGKFLTPAMRAQMHSIVQAAIRLAGLQLAFIE